MEDEPQAEPDSPGFFGKIGNWFKGSPRVDIIEPGSGLATRETRSSLLRPWAKRDQAIDQMQHGFSTLTDLMSGIRDGLTDQAKRQDELLKYLSHLPQAIQSIPENNRLQNEAIKAIGSRLDQSNEQQRMIAEILNKVHDAGQENRKTTEEVRDRVDSMAEHERKISDNLSSVGTAMQSVSRNSQASAQVLEQMRDNISHRDGQMEMILHKQASRFTLMMTFAILLSLVALVAAGVFGYVVMNRPAPVPAPMERPAAPAPQSPAASTPHRPATGGGSVGGVG